MKWVGPVLDGEPQQRPPGDVPHCLPVLFGGDPDLGADAMVRKRFRLVG